MKLFARVMFCRKIMKQMALGFWFFGYKKLYMVSDYTSLPTGEIPFNSTD